MDKNFDDAVIGVIPAEKIRGSENFDLIYRGARRPMF